MKRTGILAASLVSLLILVACSQPEATEDLARMQARGNLRVNVLLDRDAGPAVLRELGAYGTVHDVIDSIDAVSMRADADRLDAIRDLPFVIYAGPDAERHGIPIDTVAVDSMADGSNTWNLDAVDVTDLGQGRTEALKGEGVYVAVLDTGLMDSWRQYFPEDRIAEDLAMSFGGGGGERGTVSTQPNKWEHDVNGHGTHVTSTILGYSLGGAAVNGVAPLAEVIPVKVLNQNGSGWSSVVAAGIVYVADLKASGRLGDRPVVINMSLGGPVLDAVERAALDHAIDAGVVVVASAGNAGPAGMGYPGAYEPVVSVAASGWTGQWDPPSWWLEGDVADPLSLDEFYIAEFSSRSVLGTDGKPQDLDVAAPGSWIVGPYQLNLGQTSYYYLSGTSMASPHVAGIVALMLEKDGGLVQAQVETLLEEAALPFDYSGSGEQTRTILDPSRGEVTVRWGADASGHGIVTAGAALAALDQGEEREQELGGGGRADRPAKGRPR